MYSTLVPSCPTANIHMVLSAATANKPDNHSIMDTSWYRITLGIKCIDHIDHIDHISNTTIYEKTYTRPLIHLLQQQQLQFISHVLRKWTTRNQPVPIYTISWQKKHQGRQPTTFLSYIQPWSQKQLKTEQLTLTKLVVACTAAERWWWWLI